MLPVFHIALGTAPVAAGRPAGAVSFEGGRGEVARRVRQRPSTGPNLCSATAASSCPAQPVAAAAVPSRRPLSSSHRRRPRTQGMVGGRGGGGREPPPPPEPNRSPKQATRRYRTTKKKAAPCVTVVGGDGQPDEPWLPPCPPPSYKNPIVRLYATSSPHPSRSAVHTPLLFRTRYRFLGGCPAKTASRSTLRPPPPPPPPPLPSARGGGNTRSGSPVPCATSAAASAGGRAHEGIRLARRAATASSAESSSDVASSLRSADSSYEV
ncbi:hypothetical protein I4F81_009327 [Pyropia yezoensis]|uniref:Uncharacterized protein n=1 Tax=Pyropia yezoensis TaxID=2788 RepID=A0ACC3C9L8_PYRYE|nr:hypothetical protein I4F81_009327 [Neopyropia yezoensis]